VHGVLRCPLTEQDATRFGHYASLLSFDGDPTVRSISCSGCGEEHPSVTGFVLNDGAAYAIYLADWHPRHGEAYVDVVLGSFEAPEYRPRSVRSA
jgi:hypothetical protein